MVTELRDERGHTPVGPYWQDRLFLSITAFFRYCQFPSSRTEIKGEIGEAFSGVQPYQGLGQVLEKIGNALLHAAASTVKGGR